MNRVRPKSATLRTFAPRLSSKLRCGRRCPSYRTDQIPTNFRVTASAEDGCPAYAALIQGSNSVAQGAGGGFFQSIGLRESMLLSTAFRIFWHDISMLVLRRTMKTCDGGAASPAFSLNCIGLQPAPLYLHTKATRGIYTETLTLQSESPNSRIPRPEAYSKQAPRPNALHTQQPP